jgi:hypothetical protein
LAGKDDGSQRPIGKPAFEDKIVQRAVAMSAAEGTIGAEQLSSDLVSARSGGTGTGRGLGSTTLGTAVERLEKEYDQKYKKAIKIGTEKPLPGVLFGGVLTVSGMLGMIRVFATNSPGSVVDIVSLLVPQGWAIRGIVGSMHGETVSSLLITSLVLLAWSVVFFIVGVPSEPSSGALFRDFHSTSPHPIVYGTLI